MSSPGLFGGHRGSMICLRVVDMIYVHPCDMMINFRFHHYSDVIMSAMASQITGVSIVSSNVCSGSDQRKHQSSASLAFARGIHRWPVDSPHKGPVSRWMFPFDDVIMCHGWQSVGIRQIEDRTKMVASLQTFCWILMNEEFWILIKISLKFLVRFQLIINQHWFR